MFFGYFVFRPFNFDFLFAKKRQNGEEGYRTAGGFDTPKDDVIDVEIVEEYDRLGAKK